MLTNRELDQEIKRISKEISQKHAKISLLAQKKLENDVVSAWLQNDRVMDDALKVAIIGQLFQEHLARHEHPALRSMGEIYIEHAKQSAMSKIDTLANSDPKEIQYILEQWERNQEREKTMEDIKLA